MYMCIVLQVSSNILLIIISVYLLSFSFCKCFNFYIQWNLYNQGPKDWHNLLYIVLFLGQGISLLYLGICCIEVRHLGFHCIL